MSIVVCQAPAQHNAVGNINSMGTASPVFRLLAFTWHAIMYPLLTGSGILAIWSDTAYRGGGVRRYFCCKCVPVLTVGSFNMVGA